MSTRMHSSSPSPDTDTDTDTSRLVSTGSASHSVHSEDNYDLDEFTVADGFRPGYLTNTNTVDSTLDSSLSSLETPQSSLEPAPQLSRPPSIQDTPLSSSHQPDSVQPQQPPTISAPNLEVSPAPRSPSSSRPSSVSKPRHHRDSLTLANDGSNSTSVNHFPPSQPSIFPSASPSIQHPGTLTGTSTPSNQSQSSHSLSLGGATHSTAHTLNDSAYNGPRGPAHPYALYPQSTETAEAPSDHIPVGFAGMGGSYQRQIGPDGEEAGGLIGPLGHLEELPPYTRYPDPVYTREPRSAVNTTATPDGSASPQISPPGAGGIGIATRNPEFSSTEDNLAVPESRPSVQSGETSEHEVNTAARDYAEKGPVNKWQRRARKKMLGIVPYWAICMFVVGVLAVGIIMGAVLGTLLTKDNQKNDDKNEEIIIGQIPTTTDVEPLAVVPPNLSALATGLFDLPPLDVSQAPRSCFNDTTQSQAWSCEMPFRYYSMQVDPVDNAPDVEHYEISLTAVNGSEAIYVWGTQPPSINDPVKLTLVKDAFEPSRGPAWWRKIEYDKVVIVPEGSFSAPTPQKRQWTYKSPAVAKYDTKFRNANPGPMDGEKPWFCTWPNTTMEIFIYSNQNASQHSLGAPATTTEGPEPTVLSEYPPVDYTPIPNDPTPAYPQVVKFLERRLFVDGDDTAATCRQVKIVNNGKDKEDVLDANGNPVEVVVVERQRGMDELLQAHQRSRHAHKTEKNNRLKREALELTECGCLWWSV